MLAVQPCLFEALHDLLKPVPFGGRQAPAFLAKRGHAMQLREALSSSHGHYVAPGSVASQLRSRFGWYLKFARPLRFGRSGICLVIATLCLDHFLDSVQDSVDRPFCAADFSADLRNPYSLQAQG